MPWPLALPAAALYKVVGPDGRITYTDRPATAGARKEAGFVMTMAVDMASSRNRWAGTVARAHPDGCDTTRQPSSLDLRVR